MSIAIVRRDTTACDSLFDYLLQAADTLDAATDLALSPLIAAGEGAAMQDAGFDSTTATTVEAASEAELDRARALLLVAAYLERSSDPVAAQAALDAIDHAIDSGANAKTLLDASVPSVFDIAAYPLLRLHGVVVPDSITIGQPFRLVVQCSNVGSGTAVGGFVRLQTEEGFRTASSDSVPLPDLVPGDSRSISWWVLAGSAVPLDSTAAHAAVFSIISGNAGGIGDAINVATTAYSASGTGVAVSTSPTAPKVAVMPNPASGELRLEVTASLETELRVDLLDVAGRRVRVLYTGKVHPGRTNVTWHGDAEGGRIVPAGIYFVRSTFARTTNVKKIVWVR